MEKVKVFIPQSQLTREKPNKDKSLLADMAGTRCKATRNVILVVPSKSPKFSSHSISKLGKSELFGCSTNTRSEERLSQE